MTVANLAAYLLAIALALTGAAVFGRSVQPAAAAVAGAAAPVVDARGASLAPRAWQRIASLDLVGDELLAHLVESGRIAAVSTWAQGPEAWRHAGVPRLPGLGDLEAVIRARPDLVLASTWGSGDAAKVERLREAGIAVCDLGAAGGLVELAANLRRVGALTGAPERGERLAGQLERRMAALPARLPERLRGRRALVLTPVVDQVYGGTAGSSFHDIVTAAGLVDAAAGRFAEPWPRIRAEDALAIDPDVVVTRLGATAMLGGIPGFDRLPAITAGRVIELPEALYDSPGLSMLDAAEALQAAAAALPAEAWR
jgi:iron complex transport system substrate-binding protein